jgi:hypothetical protein
MDITHLFVELTNKESEQVSLSSVDHGKVSHHRPVVSKRSPSLFSIHAHNLVRSRRLQTIIC